MNHSLDVEDAAVIDLRDKFRSSHLDFRAATCDGKGDQAVNLRQNAHQACPDVLLLMEAGENGTQEWNHSGL